MIDLGTEMYSLCKELFPICRSITGDGTRKSLNILKEHINDLEIYEVPTGTKCFDWEIPKEWNINDAYVIDPDNQKIVDFKDNNLHVVGYSIPFNGEVDLSDLMKHIHTLPDNPTAIPYVTSYYKESWGFCLSHNQMKSLKPGKYKIVIDSSLENGSMTYGQLLLKGQSKKEILLSTYICHPSMANNELSGPVVTTFLTKILKENNPYYSYRILFLPETIGSIYYLSKNFFELKENLIAGFVITCIGDDNTYSFLPSRKGCTLPDNISRHVLYHIDPEYNEYTFLDRGSDERQYCSPGIDLPVCSVMRSKYWEYPEYHTSQDDLSFISPRGLYGGYEILRKCLEAIENNKIYQVNQLCEPQLGKYGLYPTISTADSFRKGKIRLDFLAYVDGNNDLVSIANIIGVPIWTLYDEVKILLSVGLISEINK